MKIKTNAHDPKTILIVEDEIAISIITSEVIKSFGYNVLTADSGEKAFEITISNEKIDLILMDIDLGSGIDGTKAARQILEKRNIPIVFLSSHTESETVNKTENIASYGYVVKNSGTAVLGASIKMAFRLFEEGRMQQNALINQREAAAKLRKTAEDLIKTGETHLNDQTHLLEVPNKLVHELRVTQIELEMQNDELRSTQEKLEISRKRYFDLYDLAPIGYLTINEKGMITEANLKGGDLLGVDRKDLIKQPLSQFILSADQDVYYLNRKKLLETGAPRTSELRILNRSGKSFLTKFEMSIFKSKAGNETMLGVIISDITEQRLAEEKIKALLAEKELLLKEVHHRVKNNLNTVAGLLEMQIDALKESAAIDALKNARNRVLSMMLMYKKLYYSENFSDLSFKEYLSPLVDEIIGIFPNNTIVKVEKNIADFIIDSKKLSDLGIIINEVLTNTMKYAFKARNNGLITISAIHSGNHVTITLSDNGIGIPESFSIRSAGTGGLQLVYMLAQLIHAEVKIERDKGTKFTMKLDL